MTQDVLVRYCERLDELGQLFLRRLHQELNETMHKGITGNQFVVMKIINDRGRATVSEVAEDLNVSMSAVTGSVDRLCRAEMVVRRRSEEDRRVVWLQLTGQGQKVVNECQASRMRVMRRIMGCLNEKELLHMISTYEKIIAFMRQEESEETGKKTSQAD